jgi:hypothetical protein
MEFNAGIFSFTGTPVKYIPASPVNLIRARRGCVTRAQEAVHRETFRSDIKGLSALTSRQGAFC